MDLFSVCETHQSSNDTINVKGYVYYGHCRLLKHKKAPKHFGGVGLFVKNKVTQDYDIFISDKSYDGILIVKFKHKLINLSFTICSVYLPPDNSPWCRDPSQFFNYLLSHVYSVENTDHFIICGDLNSRIGNGADTVPYLDNTSERNVVDYSKNNNGESLLEFLIEAKFCVVNGRILPENNCFTNVSYKGKSVVDYFLVSHHALNFCKYFNIISCTDFISDCNLSEFISGTCKVPDHSILILHVDFPTENCNVRHNSTVNNCQMAPFSFPKINFSEVSYTFMQSENILNDLLECSELINTCIESQSDINKASIMFENTLLSEIKSALDNNVKGKITKQSFWSRELELLWQIKKGSEKDYRKCKHSDQQDKFFQYKLACKNFDKHFRYLERIHKRNRLEKIEKLNISNSKLFWREVKNLGPKRVTEIPLEVYNKAGGISNNLNDVLDCWKFEFEKLYRNDSCVLDSAILEHVKLDNYLAELNMKDPLYTSDYYLNYPLTFNEIKRCVMKAKSNKSTGTDMIPNEILKFDCVIQVLYDLFNICFDYGIIPDKWSESIISPIIKSNNSDPRKPENYRGISLLSSIAKVYGSVLNNRLMKYLDKNKFLCEEQNGFRQNRSCLDHIFTLHSIIQNKLNTGTDLFIAFIDLKKAFDSINRDLLFLKLRSAGIDGKMYFSIKSLYIKSKACVKVNKVLTEWFNTSCGVRQGDTLSPTLFSIFINDLILSVNELKLGIYINESIISILLYADDIAVIAESESKLQLILNKVNEWCITWLLQINELKSNVIHFRRKRIQRSNFNFKIGNKDISFIDKYKYLGVTFSEHLDYKQHKSLLSTSGTRALGNIINKYKCNNEMCFSTYSKLFHACVAPILDYGAEVWGVTGCKELEKVQTNAARIFLGVNKYTPILSIQADIGWKLCKTRIIISMLKYWNRLLNMENNRICKQVFLWDYGIQNDNWSSFILGICETLNLEMFENLSQFDLDHCMYKLTVQDNIDWKESVNTKPKLRIYKLIKSKIETECYVRFNLSSKERSMLAQLRMGVLPINIETGRYKGIPSNERFCYNCKEVIEDEFHFLFSCPQYNLIRKNLENMCNLNLHNTLNYAEKFLYLCEDHPRQLAKFITYAFEQRQSKILYLSKE